MRSALRSLYKAPAFTITALVTLALGIGVNTSMFSALTAVMLRDLPYPESDQLVRLYRTAPQSQSWPHAPANFLDYQAQNAVFERLAAFRWVNYSLAEPNQPAERVRGMEVTSDFFPLLGLSPALGRVFTAAEDRPGADRVIVLSHALWVNRFARDPEIVGKTIRLNGEPVVVLGVMPPAFSDRLLWGRVEAWRPMAFTDEQRRVRGNNYLQMIGRLKPGIELGQAQVAMSALASRLAQAYPENNAQYGLRLLPLARSGMDDAGRKMNWMVLGLAGFVLLIACANLANLEFARTASRAREYAIRAALGATRGRLVRELLTETVLLGLGGGILGLLLAVWCNDALSRQIVIAGQAGLPLPIDLRALVFTLVVSIGTGIAFGLLPALLASRTNVNDTLKQGGRGTIGTRAQHRLRQALIVAEVALALVLLSGAGIFIRGLHRFTYRDTGWQPDGLLVGYVSLPGPKYPDAAKRRAFAEALDDRLRQVAGVKHASLANSVPAWGFSMSRGLGMEGRPTPAHGRDPLFLVNGVTPSYFDTLGLRFITGRNFSESDRPDGPRVVIINEAAARALWPGESAIGKRLGHRDDRANWLEVIGVVNDVRAPGQLGPPDSLFQLYQSLSQTPSGYLTVALRGHVAPDTLAQELRRAVTAIDPDQPVHDVVPLRTALNRELGNYAIVGWLLGGFALLGVALAAVGIYGVITSFVVQRTNEIGVRMALGAQIADILRLVLGHGLRLALLGTTVGLGGAYAVARMLGAIAPELPSAPLATTLGVTAFLLAIATFACWLPARRATRVDPISALRAE